MAAENWVTSGIGGLDAILNGLRIGDNVVWRVDDAEEYRVFVAPFVMAAREGGKRVVYVRFAAHPPLVGPESVDAVYDLDAYRGFESFTVRL
ncbi:MAG TPA: hypothetical protein VIU40_06250, partial [Geobacteraceae bacterium]